MKNEVAVRAWKVRRLVTGLGTGETLVAGLREGPMRVSSPRPILLLD
jgi:hypothetical protein